MKTKGRDLREFVAEIIELLQSQTHHEFDVHDLDTTLAEAKRDLQNAHRSLEEQVGTSQLIKQQVHELHGTINATTAEIKVSQNTLEALEKDKIENDAKLLQQMHDLWKAQYVALHVLNDLIPETKKFLQLYSLKRVLANGKNDAKLETESEKLMTPFVQSKAMVIYSM
eukprot:945204_1